MFYIAYSLNKVLEFFYFLKKARVYYGGDFIFGLSVNLNWRARRLYMARMRIISSGAFKKVDMKNNIYMKITRAV